MTITIGKYNFEGPLLTKETLPEKSGVYSVLGRNSMAERWSVVDLGDSQNIRECIGHHERARCWKKQGYVMLGYASYQCDEVQRVEIEQVLRVEFEPPCGEQ